MVGHSFTANNVTANNVYGPIFQFQDVMAQTFTDCNFNNMTSSQSLDIDKQSIAYIYKVNDPTKKGLDPTRPQFALFDNFNVNVKKKVFIMKIWIFLQGLLWSWQNELFSWCE